MPGGAHDGASSRLTVEFTVEPFRDAAPGPHVLAAVDAARSRGLDVEMGPFATVVEGEAPAVLDAVRALLDAALSHGATRVSLQVARGGA